MDAEQEPVLRVGVVLAEDGIATLEMRVPDEGYVLDGGQDATGRSVRGAVLRARLVEEAIGLSVDGGPLQTASMWSIAPERSRPPARGGGVLVRGVVAGRGFHWQKRVDQTLTGRIELRTGRGGLVLVNELPLEPYLAGVITAEMSGACPAEFLRAQCIVARSWLLAFTERKHDAEPFDRCNDDCCQRYQGTGDLSDAALDAVDSTRGLVLVAPDGRVVDANYSKSCGGVSELPEHVWGVHKPGVGALVDAPAGSAARRFLPVTEENLDDYLDGDWLARTDVYCSPNVVPEEEFGRYLGRVDEAGHYFRWTITYAREQLEELLRRKLPEAFSLARLCDLRVTKRGVSGRATEIAIAFDTAAGERREIRVADQYRIRQILHEKFLFSSAFAVRIERANAVPDTPPVPDPAKRSQAPGHPDIRTVTLRGAGWGHGVGLCQIGALGMALRGIDSGRIVRHYFPDAALRRVY